MPLFQLLGKVRNVRTVVALIAVFIARSTLFFLLILLLVNLLISFRLLIVLDVFLDDEIVRRPISFLGFLDSRQIRCLYPSFSVVLYAPKICILVRKL